VGEEAELVCIIPTSQKRDVRAPGYETLLARIECRRLF
jgi:hypothetical protein